jgi:DNA-binding beta-propeller fold protein YncE
MHVAGGLLCDRGTVDWQGVSFGAGYYHETKLAYNSHLRCLYCATEDEKLIVINCYNDEVIQTFELSESYENLIVDIYYNSVLRKLYWLVAGNENKSIVTVINGNDNTFFDDRLFTGISMFKLTGDNTDNRVFITGQNFEGNTGNYVWVLNGTTLEDIEIITLDDKFVNLMFNPNTNKLYLSPYLDSPDNRLGIINCNPISYDYYTITINGFAENMTYNPTNNRIFTCGGLGDGKINIVDGIEDILISSIDLLKPRSILYNSSMNAVFCGGYERLVKITGNSNEISAECNNNYGGTSNCLAINDYQVAAVSVNPEAGHVTFFNLGQPEPNIFLEDYRQLGGSSYFGCLNTINNKYYILQNDSYSNKSFVNIYDGATNSLINTLVLEGATLLKTCAYNEKYNKVFITSFGSNSIYVLSGTDDFNVQGIIPNITEPFKIVSFGMAGKVLCGGEYKIYIINALDNSIAAEIENPWIDIVPDYCMSELFTDNVYASCINIGGDGKIVRINLNTNLIESSVSLPITPDYIAYDTDDHLLYVIGYNPMGTPSRVCIIDEYSFELTETLIIKPHAYQAVYNPLTKRVYVLHRNNNSGSSIGGLTIIQDLEIEKTIDIKGFHSNGMFLNPLNNRLYFHSFFDPDSKELESYFTSFDCTEEVIKSVVSLEQKQNFSESFSFSSLDEEMVFIPETSNLIFGNRGFSNISVVKCYNH